MIDPQAIEEFAQVLRNARWSENNGVPKTGPWEELHPKLREDYRQQARYILERFDLVAKEKP